VVVSGYDTGEQVRPRKSVVQTDRAAVLLLVSEYFGMIKNIDHTAF
jgi:hypothetical protein